MSIFTSDSGIPVEYLASLVGVCYKNCPMCCVGTSCHSCTHFVFRRGWVKFDSKGHGMANHWDDRIHQNQKTKTTFSSSCSARLKFWTCKPRVVNSWPAIFRLASFRCSMPECSWCEREADHWTHRQHACPQTNDVFYQFSLWPKRKIAHKNTFRCHGHFGGRAWISQVLLEFVDVFHSCLDLNPQVWLVRITTPENWIHFHPSQFLAER